MWARDSSVGVATRYGMDGPGIESQCDRDFPHPFRPAFWPTQSPVQWVPGHFTRGYSGRGVVLVTQPHPAPKLRKEYTSAPSLGLRAMF
jgi:hypothetical protein